MSMTPGMRLRRPDDNIIGPWECRSGDCQLMAEFYVDLPAEWGKNGGPGAPRKKHDEWTGHFCYDHLIRVLELKVNEINDSPLRIRRVR